MVILHFVHGLYGINNGLDRYIQTFKNVINAEHYFICPKGENKTGNNDNVFEIESFFEIEQIIDEVKPNFYLVHWTGPESLKNKNDIIWNGQNFISFSGLNLAELYANIDTNPYGYIYAVLDKEKRSNRNIQNILVTHTEYKLPPPISTRFYDEIVHVSNKCLNNNKELDVTQRVIYPCLSDEIIKNLPKISFGNKLKIGWLGRLNKYDSIYYDFIKKEYGNRKDLEFYFAGEYEDHIENDRPNNFFFLGNQNANIFLNSIDVFLYPTSIDSFSLSLLEAMSKGLCCISSSVVSELASLCDSIVFTDTKTLKINLDIIIENKIFRAVIGSNSQKRVKELFSSNNFLKNWNKLLQPHFISFK